MLDALEAVSILKDAVAKHDRAIALILDRLERLEERLDTLARAKKR